MFIQPPVALDVYSYHSQNEQAFVYVNLLSIAII